MKEETKRFWEPWLDFDFWWIGVKVLVPTTMIFVAFFGSVWVYHKIHPPLLSGVVIDKAYSPPQWMGKTERAERFLIEIDAFDHSRTAVFSVSEWDYIHITNGQPVYYK